MLLSEADACIEKGVQRAKAMNVLVSCAVVDEFGELMQVDRMDGASIMSTDIAEAKAVTAANFRRATSTLASINPEMLQSIRNTVKFNLIPAAGGVPIIKNGEIVGAIGVSGATGEQDEDVATAAAS